MNYLEIKFFEENCGFNKELDDYAILVSGSSNYISPESIESIVQTVVRCGIRDAMGLERYNVNYWEDTDGLEEAIRYADPLAFEEDAPKKKKKEKK
tara:strand:+ start:55 stop:342 length:288 start_codon:yes stop_codon:yes gene_type:complete